MEDDLFKKIETEYRKLDRRWLHYHFRLTQFAVFLMFFLECAIGFIIYKTGNITTSLNVYLMKFLIIPTLFNTLLLVIESLGLKSRRLSQKGKIYLVSLMLLFISFNIFTVHGTFSSLFFIFTFPILLTAIYADYTLITLTGVLAIIGILVSELFLHWDLDKPTVWSDGLRLSNFIISLFILVSSYFVGVIIIYFEKAKKTAAWEKEYERYNLLQKIQIDELTGTYNRSALRGAIREMESDSSGSVYVYVMVDIDNFKRLNDTYGHPVGDIYLKELCRIMKQNCGDAAVFRYGGDEFSLLFKNSPVEDIVRCCETIQEDFASLDLEGAVDSSVTLSFGVARYEPGMKPSQLIKNSDEALYKSKEVKNRITVFKNSLLLAMV